MKNLLTLLFSIVGGLIVSEIIRQYEPWIGYFLYSGIFLAFCVNAYIYWRNRIKIEITRQNLHDFPYSINFTATNMSELRNSLDEKIVLECLIISLNKVFPNGKKHKHLFYINAENFSLEPHIKKSFKAMAKKDTPQLFYSNFRRYRFCPNRGMYTHIYFTGPLKRTVSPLKFYFKQILYRLFNKVDSTDNIVKNSET